MEWEASILKGPYSDLVDFIACGSWFQSVACGLFGLDDGFVHFADPV